MKNLLIRTITGILFVLILAGAILWNSWSLAAIFLLTAIVSYTEFVKIYSGRERNPGLASGLIAGILVYLLLLFFSKGFLSILAPILIIPLFTVLMAAEVLKKSGNSPVNTALTLFGVIYIFVPFAFTSFLVNDFSDPGVFTPLPLLGIFILIWVNDIFAYLGGLTAGRQKLYERISPKKTWEGTISGIVFTVIASYPISLLIKSILFTDWIILSVIISVFGIFGDLFESMMKRNNQLKDSGSILPGHGGLLDRFDAFLFSMPAATVYILLFTR